MPAAVVDRAGHRPEGAATRGKTAPNRLRRVDLWIAANQARLLQSSEGAPLVVDLGFGASPVTTVELYERLRAVRPDVEVVGLEIDPVRVEEGRRFLAESGRADHYRGLTFALGGFELPVPRAPLLVRAFNVLRQYDEEEAWRGWDRLCEGLAPDGVLVEGTCDETGRRAVWVTLGRSGTAGCLPGRRAKGRTGGSGPAEARTITFAARVSTLSCPSELAERLPKTLIHHNVPGEPIHHFLTDFDRSWAIAAPQSVFGPRQRWIAAVEHLSLTWPLLARPPAGGRARWRLGEVTLPWAAIAPRR
ncbi:MAG: hypothetical protein LLG45_02260, partial [Actinomycetia bacterium]|nr:hypothetical protein [Actinomycetes bacterium]